MKPDDLSIFILSMKPDLINRFNYDGNTIEIYREGNSYSAVLNSNQKTGKFISAKKAFAAVGEMMDKKIANDLLEISKMMKSASNPASVIRKIEKELTAEMEAHVVSKSHPGSYYHPPEPGEIEVTHAYIEGFPELSVEDAEILPNRFECTVSEVFRDEEMGEEAEVSLYFQVTITSKKLLKDGKVEIEFDDKFTGWDYN